MPPVGLFFPIVLVPHSRKPPPPLSASRRGRPPIPRPSRRGHRASWGWPSTHLPRCRSPRADLCRAVALVSPRAPQEVTLLCCAAATQQASCPLPPQRRHGGACPDQLGSDVFFYSGLRTSVFFVEISGCFVDAATIGPAARKGSGLLF